MPNGIPTPRPIFWFRESALLSADGASESAVALTAGLEDDVEDLTDDLVDIENVAAEDADVRVADDRSALLGIEDDAERTGREDSEVVEENGAEEADCVAVVSSPVDCGVAVGHAVSGPNLTIK